MKLTYFIYLQITIHRLIKHFTVIYPDANKQFLTLSLIFFVAKKSPYLGPQSPYQKLQISLFEPKKISHVWVSYGCQHPGHRLLDFWMFFFFFLFFENLVFQMPWPPIKISDLDKVHMVGIGLLQKHFSKTFVKYLQWQRNKCQFPLFPL